MPKTLLPIVTSSSTVDYLSNVDYLSTVDYLSRLLTAWQYTFLLAYVTKAQNTTYCPLLHVPVTPLLPINLSQRPRESIFLLLPRNSTPRALYCPLLLVVYSPVYNLSVVIALPCSHVLDNTNVKTLLPVRNSTIPIATCVPYLITLLHRYH